MLGILKPTLGLNPFCPPFNGLARQGTYNIISFLHDYIDVRRAVYKHIVGFRIEQQVCYADGAMEVPYIDMAFMLSSG